MRYWGGLSVTVIFTGIGICDLSSNLRLEQFAFHFMLMPFWKVMNQLVLPTVMGKQSGLDYVTSLLEGKFPIQTNSSPVKN